MVSGGSDSTALLELMHAYVAGTLEKGELAAMLAKSLPEPDRLQLSVLHVNHMLRGQASDEDERFVVESCALLDIPCEVVRVDISARAQEDRGGMEAVARKERYRLAQASLERAIVSSHARDGIICTAHTLDDRVETFFMRALVGTGPSGLASIPRERGNIRRPLLDANREQLREWLRSRHPGSEDEELWREDETNATGTNFRSRIRRELMPTLRELRPGFEPVLGQTMDLIADEERDLAQQADSIVYRCLVWDGTEAFMPRAAFEGLSRPMARRVLRGCLLVVNPDARLEAKQIDRILDGLGSRDFVTETSGGLRARFDEAGISIRKAQ